MIDHAYEQHPVFPRDQCEKRLDDPNDQNIYGICGEPKSTHQKAPAAPPLFEHGPLGFCDVGPASQKDPHRQQPQCVDWRPVKAEKPERKRWPRKVGWTKLLARRKACKHVFTKGRIVAAITFAAASCPRCLADEVAYWKGRTHSAEGQRKAMIRAAETAIVQVEARSLIAK